MPREADAATKVFLSDESVARELIDLAVPNLLDPKEELREMHPEEILMVFDDEASSKHKRLTAVDRIRDLLFSGVVLSGEKRDYIIIGIENQTRTDLAMPVRVFLLTVPEYARQVQKIAEKHRRDAKEHKERRSTAEGKSVDGVDGAAGEERPMSTKELLSGLREGDRLKPVITIVVNWSSEPWSGPRTLQELINMPEDIAGIVDNNRLIILEPSALTDEQLASCGTDLRLVLKYLRTGNDKEELARLLQEDPGYDNMDVAAAHVITAVTGMPVRLPEKPKKGEKFSMMKAVAEMIEDGKRNGVNDTNSAWLRAIQDSGLSLKSGTDKGSGEVKPKDVISEALAASNAAATAAANARWARAVYKQGLSIETIAQAMDASAKVVEQWLSESGETE